MLLAIFFCSIAVPAQVKNIVLVRGAFADGSGWHKVYTILKAKGYNVSIVGNPNTGIAEDIAATKRVLDRQFTGKRSGGKVSEIKGSHLLFLSRAEEFAEIIDSAREDCYTLRFVLKFLYHINQYAFLRS